MCGILGFNWNDERLVMKLGQLLKHRGPDQEGYYSDKDISLGHRRLSIIDLSKKGKQPMFDEDKRYYITYNGEIFNYKELKKDLKEFDFKSETDTEVLLYGYKKYGKKILEKLNGQFAFCIYDKKKKELFLARDRAGILPLYYYFDGKKFIFGSELKVILESDVPKELDKFSVNYYLMYGHCPRKKSIIRNSFKIEPGHYMTFSLKNKSIKEYEKYWNFKLENKITDEKEAKKKIIKELDKSVKRRMIADVPVGAFLSGGVDSSAIVALMSKYTDNLNTFSVKFDYDNFDESKYAKIISDKFGTNHHIIKFTSKDVKKLIPRLIYHYDEPFADPSMIPMYLVSKVARQHVTVSLSGDGGDELFGGYVSYKQKKWLHLQNYYPKVFNKIGYQICKNFNNKFTYKAAAFFQIGEQSRRNKFPRLMSYLSKDEFETITGEKAERFYREYSKDFEKSQWLNEAIWSDLNNYLPCDILNKVDKAAMANSLETRPPFLDKNMIELASKIDPKLKMKKGETKYILKKTLERILPNEILYRKKQGFGVPLKYYFRNELRDLVEKYVINYDNRYINKEYLEEIKEKLDQEDWKKDHSRIIFRILMLNMWYEKWIKKSFDSNLYIIRRRSRENSFYFGN